MASSSSFASNSQYCPQWKYDVFLSFRGADTRTTFTSHLYEGLKNRGIFTFQDDKRLEQGDSISEELLKAIEESQVALIIFSKNYATSRWCLNELVKIMECKEEKGQIVIPVFYDVDLSHVRHQTESFAEAFSKHESKYTNDIEGIKKVKGWRTALSDAADLKGCNIHGRIESECIRELVDDVSSKLCKTSSSYLQDIVGIDTHLEKVKSLLEMETNDVRILGIWGMGGVGKTTIAKAVFDTLSPQFQGASFLADVKETNTNEMHSLQNILLSELLREDKRYVNIEEGKRLMAHRLRFMKDEAPDEHIKKLALEVVSHAKGLPLALRLWGIWLHNQDTTMWREVVDMIKRESSPDVVKNLKISFEGLQDKEKTIFLGIACFFRGRKEDETIEILESYDLGARIRLRGLIEKSIVFITIYDTIQMHDLIQDMGKYVVKMQKDSGQPSRLWNIEDFDDVMVNNTQFLSLRRIDLSYSYSLKRTPDFKGMPNLEYLNLWQCTSLEEVHHSLKYCKKLIELNLNFCTKLERFPEILGIMKQGTAIKIMTSYSGIRELPLSFFDHQPHLIELHLNDMKNLVSLPSSICKLKGLVKLNVSRCSKLESLPEEIGDLENLEELDASYTLISRSPSSIIRLNKLKVLSFGQHRSEDGVFFVFPLVNEGLLSLKYLDLSGCNIIDGRLPEDIGSLSSLEWLQLSRNNFEHLPRSISELGALKNLDLSHCKRLTQLPEDIACLSSLEKLFLKGNNFEYLPQSISKLGALEYLNLLDCKRLTQLPEFPQQLETIDADWSNDLICNSLFQNIISLQHDICSSHSLSLRVFRSWAEDIPSWFNYQGMGKSVLVNLPKNWYVSDNFLGFAVCHSGEYYIDCITAHLIPLSCDGGLSSMTQEFALSNNSEYSDEWSSINFLLVPLGGLWDASNANEKTPNDYGCIKLDFIGETDDAFGETDDDFEETDDDFGENMKIGVRLLYKNESELCIGIRKSRYEEEATCSSSKKQRP
ncbi:hypothetical protein MTR67_046571 [Solanum verrucosum]|uniref:ADP-ribosyl cyclase/cyclic ADP-ribose hydrolase n=1 Tax=Solanum verrucosum TaxID=315347 RepID=A0AAF0UY61_SOLVR|nr:hypothetical protein MTR67_046571 [Solanum verrucosum]